MNNVKNYNCINLWHLCSINVMFFNYIIRLTSSNLCLNDNELIYGLDDNGIYKKVNVLCNDLIYDLDTMQFTRKLRWSLISPSVFECLYFMMFFL